MVKIAVYGDAYGPFPEKLLQKVREVGKQIAIGKNTVITGACNGLPNEAVFGASVAGGKCIGFSPATSMAIHIKKYQMPTQGYSQFVFVPKTYTHNDNRVICLKYRNLSSTIEADAAIIVGGRIGTMNEFTLMYDFGKTIGVLEGSGGITKSAIKRLIVESNKKTGAVVIFDKNPKTLVKRVVASCHKKA